MRVKIKIKRQQSPESEPYFQTFAWNCDESTTVATILREMNEAGDPENEIAWECSCLQKKCGACAMVINGSPRLACDTKIGELKSKSVVLEPLKKFPVVRDLIVDRRILRENLIALHNWLEREAVVNQKNTDLAYDASRCLQCGCCLEVCPNFTVDDSFFGAAAFVPASRILSELPKSKKYEILGEYKKYIYSGCGKSLSCHDVCPAEIDVERKLSNSNAVAVWKRFLSKE